MRPRQSYTIWFAQRTGSTLLYAALASTGLAGRPGEWLLTDQDQSSAGLPELQEIWRRGTTPNGVFGVKCSWDGPLFEQWFGVFRKASPLPQDASRPVVWDSAFPNGKHIFMTRRNKVRLAVSWWRAIVSGEWHRVHGQPPLQADLADRYDFAAIRHLLLEADLREAAVQEFFSQGDITPLTLVYEDFVANYEETVHRVLDFLDLGEAPVLQPHYDRIADEVAEAWVQRFRQESQSGWTKRIW
ncbi:Stf0 family sulfotransferase [Deinococcus peraridilitoris]|uniref:Sulphotransferase Stf0 domain-containing protein n=1 Tax=Deinococcus peraridilitoris (strain DSM 19664 / LMG 22246 / CIP 109416 / KR-200) TaxID=937777 RepID=L0A3C8_DEIPD|nr:Stf0 family sulfotransferase [Deinococcus peraridilitoris]AFZ67672.1 hypothetical protein Deipe_2186 [Deinococcus peraridilitoris DSM 19664]